MLRGTRGVAPVIYSFTRHKIDTFDGGFPIPGESAENRRWGTECDSRCDVNPDSQHCQFQDGNSHNNDVVPGDDTIKRVAKIEFIVPKVHEKPLRIKIGRLNSVALLVIDTGAALSIPYLTEQHWTVTKGPVDRSAQNDGY